MQKVNALPAQAIELNDIHVPEQISNFPIAYGWWLLAALLMLLITITIIKIRKHAKCNVIKKQALKQLKKAQVQSIDNTMTLLKWAAIHYFSRAEIAKLYGDSLQLFLTSKLPIKHQKSFLELSEQAFLNQYKTSIDESNSEDSIEKFTQAAKLWLTYALPPKPLKLSKVKVTNIHKTTHKNTIQGASS